MNAMIKALSERKISKPASVGMAALCTEGWTDLEVETVFQIFNKTLRAEMLCQESVSGNLGSQKTIFE